MFSFLCRDWVLIKIFNLFLNKSEHKFCCPYYINILCIVSFLDKKKVIIINLFNEQNQPCYFLKIILKLSKN